MSVFEALRALGFYDPPGPGSDGLLEIGSVKHWVAFDLVRGGGLIGERHPPSHFPSVDLGDVTDDQYDRLLLLCPESFNFSDYHCTYAKFWFTTAEQAIIFKFKASELLNGG